MYEKTTDRFRKAMQLAHQEALRFNHEYVGTEHILLGLIKEGSGVAAAVLAGFKVGLRNVRLAVESQIQSGQNMVVIGKLPYTPRAKKVIGLAMEEADDLKHNYVGTEHLLLALLREEEGIASKVLKSFGLDLLQVRQGVLEVLGHAEPASDPKTPPPADPLAGIHSLIFVEIPANSGQGLGVFDQGVLENINNQLTGTGMKAIVLPVGAKISHTARRVPLT